MIDMAAARRLANQSDILDPLGCVTLDLCDELEASRAACTRTVEWLRKRQSLSTNLRDAAMDAAIRDLERFVPK
jgi:hypothetical protein